MKNKNINITIKNNLIYVVVLCASILLPQVTSAQAAAFVMSSVGSMANTASSSTAINFKSTATCIDVQSGAAVLSGTRANGQFAINCEVTMQFNTLGIRLFPNPVSSNTKVKLVNTPPLTETFNLSIWTAEGTLITTRKETGYNLFQGMTLDLGGLNSGTYVLKIESTQFVDAIKFIKAN
jgi:hypothetical protein